MVYFIVFLMFISTSVVAGGSNFQFNLSSGAFYSEGRNIDKENTELKSLPLAFKISRGLHSVKISTNYSRYFSRNKNGNETFRGIGNVYLSTQSFIKTTRLIDYLDIRLKLKFPAKEKDPVLSTKGFDFQLSIAAYYQFSKNWLIARASYRLRDNDLLDTFSSELSYSRQVKTTFNIGLSANYQQALEKTRNYIIENMAYISWRATKRVQYTFYYIKGYKDPRLLWGSGLQVSYRW